MCNLSDAAYAELGDLLEEATMAFYLEEITQPQYDHLENLYASEKLTEMRDAAAEYGMYF